MNEIKIENISEVEMLMARAESGSLVTFHNCGMVSSDAIRYVLFKAGKLIIRGDCMIEDLSCLESDNLESIKISAYSQKSFFGAIDGTKLPRLKTLHVSGMKHSNLVSLDKCASLEDLHLASVDLSKERLFATLNHLSDLSLENVKVNKFDAIGSNALIKAHLINVSLKNLEFFSECCNLESLSIARMRNLEDLCDLVEMKNLESFSIWSMTKLPSLEPVSMIESLRELQLVDVGSIESLKFLEKNRRLERFVFIGDKAKVLDLDFSWLETLKQIYYAKFRDRRGYSHKSSDFPKFAEQHKL